MTVWRTAEIVTRPAGSIGQAFRRLASTADVPLIRLPELRHTHASHLLIAGANVKVVSERLGHASVSFTLTPTPA